MRSLYVPLLAFVALTFTPTISSAIEYPWCAQYGRVGGFGRNCGFSTLQQCMATVSGIGGYCESNGRYTGPRRPARRTDKRDAY